MERKSKKMSPKISDVSMFPVRFFFFFFLFLFFFFFFFFFENDSLAHKVFSQRRGAARGITPCESAFTWYSVKFRHAAPDATATAKRLHTHTHALLDRDCTRTHTHC